MVAGLGAGSVMSGFFHLTTHAAFKALLFLAAGSVIHAVGSNELGDMGGLARRMRLTTTVFVIGALALAGVPLFAGFFSKDFILETVFDQKLWLPLGALLLSGFLTAFYMGRVIALAFFGTPSSKAEHAHESGPAMALPLIALAFLSVAVGWLGPRMAEMIQADYAFHLTPVGAAATLLALGGLFFAWLVYARRAVPSSALAWFAPIGEVARSGALDRLYGFAFRRVMLGVAALAGWFDRYIVDGLMNFIAWLAIVTGQRLRRIQTGNVLDYVYAVVAGAALLIAWGLVR
jgi:NADH-quinone oxidoreductase subunit L